MTIKQEIAKDSVLIRWVRTAATTIIAIGGAVGILISTAVYIFGPRVADWAESLVLASTEEIRAEMRQNAELNRQNAEHLSRLDGVVERLEETTAALATAQQGSLAPSWRWDPVDTTISDGEIGGLVQITATGYKLRDCGIPTVELYFVNGGGVFHRFTDASLLTPDGRGVALPVDPSRTQQVRYTARIPEGDGVTPGRAQGYISVTYPDACPFVEPATAGPLQFRITG